MARLRLVSFVAAPIEDVYQYVTTYGPDGPVDGDTFEEKYGETLQHDADAIIVREDVRRYPEDDPQLITWRCTFDYPASRTMEALDSAWADRYDSFEADGDRTRWTVRWDTRLGGLRGRVQWLVFRLITHKSMRRDLVDPIKDHFETPGASLS